jgi:hypothetical protein
MYISDYSATLCIFVTSLAFIFDVSKSKILKDVQLSFIIAYVLRIIILYLDIYNVFPVFGSGGDTEAFYKEIIRIASGDTYTGKQYFSLIFGLLSRYIGVSRMYIQYINVLFSMCSIYFVMKSLYILNINTKVKNKATKIIGILPIYMCLSCILLREAIIYMLVSISLYCFISWYERCIEYYFILSLFWTFLAMLFHSGIIGIGIGYIFVRLLYNRKQNKLIITIKTLLMGLFCLLIIVFIYNKLLDTVFYKFASIDSLSDVGSYVDNKSGSSYSAFVGNSNSIFNFIIYTIPRIFFYIFSPIPFMWRNFSDVISFMLDSVFYIVVLINSIKLCSLKNEEWNNKVLLTMLLIISLTTCFVFAWGTTNAGTALRHRNKLLSLYIIMWAIDLQYKDELYSKSNQYIYTKEKT